MYQYSVKLFAQNARYIQSGGPLVETALIRHEPEHSLVSGLGAGALNSSAHRTSLSTKHQYLLNVLSESYTSVKFRSELNKAKFTINRFSIYYVRNQRS